MRAPEVFILDDQSYRDLRHPVPNQRQIYGEAQIDWLIWQLETSSARFKVVCSGSSILNPAESPGNATAAPQERLDLLEQLRKREVDGVLFITGGKPFGELTRLVRAGARDLREVTVGPVTARPADENREINYLREPGSSIRERSFVHARFHGPENAREVTITARSVTGQILWSLELRESDLQAQ